MSLHETLPRTTLLAAEAPAPATRPAPADEAPARPAGHGAPDTRATGTGSTPAGLSQADIEADAQALAAARKSNARIPLRPLGLGQPFGWIAAGWQDFRRCPQVGLFYGSCFVTMGWLLAWVFREAPAYVLALSAGFLLIGPFLCMGMYQASRHLQRGERPDLGDSLLAWESKMGTLGVFGFVLLVLEMLWARSSLVIFAVTFDGMPDFKGSIMALFNPENTEFIVAYIIAGGFFAGLIFSVSVVAIPMILDRSTDAISACLTSLRLVLTQPGVMLLWGALITLTVFAAMLPWFLGLLLVGPVIGHASWHAYRAAVGEPPADEDEQPAARGGVTAA